MPVLVLLSALAAAPPPIAWQPWGDEAFATAAKEHKLVLLDVEAVWCHWCHVQDETTYRDRAVVSELSKHFISVKVDQDAQPALSQRYLSWGWPAIVLLTADGKEILKHRGYAEPAEMLALLRQAERNPHPQPEVAPSEAPVRGALSEEQRKDLLVRDLDAYDAHWGGWGSGHKMLDADELELALVLAAHGDEKQAQMARQTLDAAARSLLDPIGGGVCQYSATPDWASPHFERLLSVQADALTLYSRAYALFDDVAFRDAAAAVARYVTSTLTSPEGALDVSQDADLSASMDGAHYYALSEAERKKAGIPIVDTHLYSRECGLGALAWIAYADATGDVSGIASGRRAVDWVRAHRAIEGGGYRHGEETNAPLALSDTLSMGRALLELYAATGERPYLEAASQAAAFIAARFDAGGRGFASEPPSTVHVFGSAFISEEDNAALARWANRLFHYTGMPEHRAMAEKAMRYLTMPEALGEHGLRGEILLADQELATEPLHVTVVGHKDDAAAAALFREARRTPVSYLRTDWLDAREPPVPNLAVTFPPLSKAAAFVCGKNSCSLPQLTPEQLRTTLKERR